MALRIQTRISEDVFIVRCNGRIVFGDEGAALRERVAGMLSGSPKIVLNLSGVYYVDSGGLGILVGLSVSALNRGGELKLVNPSQRVSDLLQRTKLTAIIGVYRNDEDALARSLPQTGSLRESSASRKTDKQSRRLPETVFSPLSGSNSEGKRPLAGQYGVFATEAK